ncbi:hypothetical protein B0H13DRAFT_2091626 [Mycena leptocephala]|nr:hypothetical protein B0H13DRAFT_2091626 [Mycena leptocephala]
MSTSSRMHGSFATAARAPEHLRTLTETSRGSVFSSRGVERSQHLKDFESRAVHRRASEQGADVVGKQLITSILLSTTSTGCKPRESRVSSTPFTSINDSASSFKDSGCPKAPSPVRRVAGDEVVEMEKLARLGEGLQWDAVEGCRRPSIIATLCCHHILLRYAFSLRFCAVTCADAVAAYALLRTFHTSTRRVFRRAHLRAVAISRCLHAARSPSFVSSRLQRTPSRWLPRRPHRSPRAEWTLCLISYLSPTSSPCTHLHRRASYRTRLFAFVNAAALVEVDRAITTAPLPSRPFGSRIERAAAPPAACSSPPCAQHITHFAPRHRTHRRQRTRDSCLKSMLYSSRLHHPGKDPPWYGNTPSRRAQAHPANSGRPRTGYAAFRNPPSARPALVFSP